MKPLGVKTRRGPGRPLGSEIRQNIIELLAHLREAHGYAVYKSYVDIFPRVTMRSIYYHLVKGVETKEFAIAKVRREKGNYSWGPEATKTYYKLGPLASPKGLARVERHFKARKEKRSAE